VLFDEAALSPAHQNRSMMCLTGVQVVPSSTVLKCAPLLTWFHGGVSRCTVFCCLTSSVFLSSQGQPCGYSRERTISFTLDQEKLPSTVHGFAGYFEAVLYKDVTISTHPATHTPKMLSWFPMFFPLVNPVRLEPGSQVTVSMWRLSSSSQVLSNHLNSWQNH
jgi:hypothetical protein